jgi:hypothetical protein
MSSTIETKARLLAEAAKNNVYSNEQVMDLVKAVDEADEDKDGRKDQFRAAAKRLHEEEGSLEFDDNAIVSVSEDGGAYVQCWKYVEPE